MWIFTKDGFYSAVEDRNDHGRLVVRARSRADVVRLAVRLKVKAYRSERFADYPFRLFCSKKAWSEYLAKCGSEIDYDNFKNGMSRLFDNRRMDQLHEIWAIMAGNVFGKYRYGGAYEDEEASAEMRDLQSTDSGYFDERR